MPNMSSRAAMLQRLPAGVGFDEFDALPAAFDALRKPSADCKILIDPAA